MGLLDAMRQYISYPLFAASVLTAACLGQEYKKEIVGVAEDLIQFRYISGSVVRDGIAFPIKTDDDKFYTVLYLGGNCDMEEAKDRVETSIEERNLIIVGVVKVPDRFIRPIKSDVLDELPLDIYIGGCPVPLTPTPTSTLEERLD